MPSSAGRLSDSRSPVWPLTRAGLAFGLDSSLTGRLFAGMKIERDAVHAIALPGWRRAVVEDMAEMTAAAAAVDLGAGHEKAAVGLGFDRTIERRLEAWPSGSAVELGVRGEKRLAAAGAMVNAGPYWLSSGLDPAPHVVDDPLAAELALWKGVR
jgi:hypothetical protein